MHELLPPGLTSDEYESRFGDPAFGLDAARELARRHGLAADPVRLVAGSNLLFRIGPDRWLKIIPAVNDEEYATERWMLENVRLPVRTPEIVAAGELDGWDYLLLTHVEGIAFDKAAIAPRDRVAIAEQTGAALAALHTVPTGGFSRPEMPWEPFLEARIETAARRAERSGADATWSARVGAFVERHAEALRADRSRVLVHADLYFDHLLVHEVAGRWEVAGIIDFADTVVAPRAYELVDPVLWLFRSERDPLLALLDAFGCARATLDASFAERMLALAALHRFTRFGDAFRRELDDSSIDSMESLAARICPVA